MPNPPKVVTFDCAQTLVEVRWALDEFVRDCMGQLGVTVSESAGRRYLALYAERLPEYWEINRRRDPELGRQFWRRLGADWLLETQGDVALLDPLQEVADRLTFGPESTVFRPYPDAIPCLWRLRNAGIGTAVVSNWDYTLHRVLRMFGMNELLDLAVASLEEGVEKPDPRLFEITLARLGVGPEEVLHVGDSEEDDATGAEAAGLRYALLDRSLDEPKRPWISSLDSLEETFDWV